MYVIYLLFNVVMICLFLIWFFWWIWFDLDFFLVLCVLICFYICIKWYIFYLMCWYFNIVLYVWCYIYNLVCKCCNEYYFLEYGFLVENVNESILGIKYEIKYM